MFKGLTGVRRWLIRLLEDTEDDLTVIRDEDYITMPELHPEKPATLDELRDNHLMHLTMGMNGLHIRVGRLEAKTGLVLALLTFAVGVALAPWIEEVVSALL